MKTLVAASLLLALTIPAHARTYTLLDCGSGVEVSVGKSMGVTIIDPNIPHVEGSTHDPYPAKGKFTLEWDHRRNVMRLNGKSCRNVPEDE